MVQRRNNNRIFKLHNNQGETLHTKQQIQTKRIHYFQDLLTETVGNWHDAIEQITQHIPRLVSEEQNEALLRPTTQEEVNDAMQQNPVGKAPGPDGFTADFFHYCWHFIKANVWQIVEESRKTLGILLAFNATFLTLIPKEDKSTTPQAFRPIALCNVIFKLITKVIANRIKPLLPNLISKEKIGYVEARQILDNIILTQELIHYVKLNHTPRMLIKLDMSKAFEKISWQYIREILKAFGFHPTWIQRIYSLISSSFSILLNRIPTSTFRPSRGIR